ncbi:hypothetical protein AVEN_255225-1 [Araneus ventricosus]|uniref:Uncharacterized protein n=1 Tax=Araneus ventricosus TaxID=182803 RepID=A0A4Y2BAM2_ARAVE|nr:hypothetical protein AVEN_255225-1 [Araneus ventricosus]
MSQRWIWRSVRRSRRMPLQIRPRWPSDKVSALGPEDSKFETRFRRVLGLLHVKSYVGSQTSSRWRGAEVWRGCQLRRRPRHLIVVQNYVPK